MTTLTQTQASVAPRGAFPLAGPTAVAAGLVVLDALWYFASVLQIDSAVAGMDRSTQQNAALVEQASAATESLKDQSQRLVQWLDRFHTA